MSITINIEDLLQQRIVESSRIEYKKDWNPSTIIHSICAFANDIENIGGGYILIGVEEDNGIPKLPISGISKERVDSILKKLRKTCHFIEPLYEPETEPILYDDKYIIVIKAAGGYGRPYKAPKDVTSKQSHKYYYIRKFSSSVIASPEEEKELFYMASDIPYDDRPNLLADINDLNREIMREYLKTVNSSLYQLSSNMDALEIAKSLQLLEGPPEDMKPLNVGLLMFSEQPEKYFRYARIEIVHIPDPSGNGMTERIFTGPLHYQLKNALSYIKNNLIAQKIIKLSNQAEAERIDNYPFAAIEEILANAIYHRSYQIHEPITVRITQQNIEITSCPGFDRSISDIDIQNYQIRARRYRNRRIGDFLKELHLIEGRNTGFPNAIRALKENGSPMLQFIMNPERDFLSVIIPIHEVFNEKSCKAEKQLDYQQKILELCTDGHGLTLTELSHAMGYKGITAKLRSTTENLITSGQLIRFTNNRKILLKTMR